MELDSREKLEVFLRGHGSKLNLPEIPKGSQQTMYEFYVTDYGKCGQVRFKQSDLKIQMAKELRAKATGESNYKDVLTISQRWDFSISAVLRVTALTSPLGVV